LAAFLAEENPKVAARAIDTIIAATAKLDRMSDRG
jgi:hypothetical protein